MSKSKPKPEMPQGKEIKPKHKQSQSIRLFQMSLSYRHSNNFLALLRLFSIKAFSLAIAHRGYASGFLLIGFCLQTKKQI